MDVTLHELLARDGHTLDVTRAAGGWRVTCACGADVEAERLGDALDQVPHEAPGRMSA